MSENTGSMQIFRIVVFVILIGYLPFTLFYVHLMLVTGLNPFIGSVFGFFVFLLMIPFILKSVRWTRKNWLTNTKPEPFILFGTASFTSIILSFVNWHSTVDIHIHDTYFVIDAGQLLLLVAGFFGLIALIYYALIAIFRQNLKISSSRIHFWLTFFCLNFLIFSYLDFHPEVTLYLPRRYVEYAGWEKFHRPNFFERIKEFALILMLTAQALFLINIISSFTTGKPGSKSAIKA